jgi:hypothetical protein
MNRKLDGEAGGEDKRFYRGWWVRFNFAHDVFFL